MAVLDRQNIRVGGAEERLQDRSLANAIKGTLGLKGPGIRHAGLRHPPEPNIELKRGYMLGGRRKTTKKLKPNSLQSPNGLPPHKRLMGWQVEGLASGPDSGWPRVRGLLGLPRLPRIPVRCGAALGVCGVAPRTPGRGGPSHPHRVTGMGSTGPKARRHLCFHA
jgi:hypothetical protein